MEVWTVLKIFDVHLPCLEPLCLEVLDPSKKQGGDLSYCKEVDVKKVPRILEDSLFNVVVEAGGHDLHPAVEAKLFILILLFLKLPVLFLGPECSDICKGWIYASFSRSVAVRKHVVPTNQTVDKLAIC